MKRTALVILAVASIAAALFAASCQSATARYVRYRLSPDRAPAPGRETIRVPGLDEPATIWLDEYDVPHVRAASETALYYAYGYAQARDRRFQMEILKMLAAGRIRELVGSMGDHTISRLELFSRMIGLYRDARKMVDSLPPNDLAQLEAYSAGVNDATAREPVPMEFRLLGYEPEPWTPYDSGLIIALISFGLNKNWEHELGRMELAVHQMRTGSSLDRALAIWPHRFELPPHLIGEKPDVDPFADWPAVPPELAAYLEGWVRDHPLTGEKAQSEPPVAAETALIVPDLLDGHSASNNWAMDGTWTGTGSAAFSSDPHMPHALPSLGYLAHLSCEGCEGGSYQVIGGGFVGLPAIPFGTNGRVAWGATSNWADAIDLYVEQVDPADPTRYRTPDGYLPFDVRTEVFKVRDADGSVKQETRIVRSTRNGVVINDFVERVPDDFPVLSMRRDLDMGPAISALRRLYRAENVTQGRKALYGFTAMIGHWALADADGNVAYVGTVALPRRAHHFGTFPTPGWLDKYRWDGTFPVEELPYAENPPQGFVGTANNQVIQPESFGHPINFEGDIPHRYARIREVIAAGRGGLSPVEHILALQADGLDMGWIQLRPVYAPILTPFAASDDPIVADAARALLAWDGRCDSDAVGPTIFQALNAYILSDTMEDEVSEATHHFLMTYFNVEPMAFNLFSDPANPAWDDRRTPGTETAAEVIAAEFVRTVGELRKVYGDDVARWRWQLAAPFVLHHAFGNQKELSRYVNRPMPTIGASNTVYKNQFERDELTRFPIKHGPVLRVAVDLSDMSRSRMVLPGGQSGRPASAHYDDQLPMWNEQTGMPMELDFGAIAENAKGKIAFVPGR